MAVNSTIGECRGEVAVAALSSFHFPDSVPLTTYAIVYLFSPLFHPLTLPVTDIAVFRHSQPTDFSFSLTAQDDILVRTMKYLMTHFFDRLCSILSSVFLWFPICPVPCFIFQSHYFLQITLLWLIII